MRKIILAQKNIAPIPIPHRTPSPAIWSARDLGPISAEHPGVQPRDCDCNPFVNQIFYVRNGVFHFRVHESTQSGEYNLGLFTHYLIKREDERRNMIPLVMEVLPVLVFITFPHLGKIVSIPSVLYVSASAYTNLRSIMSSVWISHRPQINMSPRVYRMLLPWITSPSDILRPWWIRSPLCMYVG